jgi:hypothetical protein
MFILITLIIIGVLVWKIGWHILWYVLAFFAVLWFLANVVKNTTAEGLIEKYNLNMQS